MQKAVATGSGNVIVQIRGDGNSIVAGLPHLMLTQHRGLARRINTNPDTNKPREIDVLRASTCSIPRVGREREMSDLRAWLNRDTPISVQVMTGGAGHGKTRLALELIDEMTPLGWRAGFLTKRELRRFREQHNLSDWGWDTPVLAVVDYASASAQDLHAWLKELAANAVWEDDEAGGSRPLRLLLLERHARRDGWWAVAFGCGNDAAVLAPMLDPAAPYLIDPIECLDQRRQILATTLARIGSTVTPPAAGDALDFDLRLAELTWGGVPLLLMMAAATAAREGFGHVLALGSDTLAFNIAETELARIRKVVMGAGVPWTLAPVVDHLVAVATLCQGIPSQAAVDVIKQESAALGYDVPAGPATLRDALSEALSNDAGGIAAVEPDLIGEALLLSVWKRDKVDALHAIARSYAAQRIQVAETVIRTCQDYVIRGHRYPLDWLKQIRADCAHDLGALIGLSDAMPTHTLELCNVAAELCSAVVEQVRHRARGSNAPDLLAKLASSLNDLSNRLSDLGRREEAYDKSREATNLFRDLVTARPDVHRPGLAMSLNNMSVHLSHLEQLEDALAASQEATDIYSALAATRPAAFHPDLAMSLTNLSNRLFEFGRRDRALAAIEEATDIYRKLVTSTSDTFRPDLAGSLNNLSSRLSDMRRWEDALAVSREATGIYRDLAAAKPDAYRPGLARSLNNLSNRVSKLGRHQEALDIIDEAVAIVGELAASSPDAFRPYLAMYLNNRSTRLSEIGRPDDALAAIEKAVSIRRDLAATQSDVFGPDLARSLDNLSSRLSDVERREDALAAIDEATYIYRDLAAVSPGVFRPNLAGSLNNLSNRLSKLGRPGEAFAAIEEAVATLREPFLARPVAYVQQMATMSRNYRRRCKDARRSPNASLLAPIDEALQRLDTKSTNDQRGATDE